MDKIDRAMLLKMMDDDQDQETQNQAVDLAKKDENIEFWIQPDGYKYSWDNCARVIIEKKDKELAPYMSLLASRFKLARCITCLRTFKAR